MVVDDPGGRMWKLSVQPSWWLAWSPRLRNVRTKDSQDVLVTGDPVDILLFDSLGFIWKKILWLPAALLLFVVEFAVLVLLSPITLVCSAIGVRRHRVVAVAQDDGTRREVVARGLLASRRARRELASSLAARPAAA